jgi:hypothetical protein
MATQTSPGSSTAWRRDLVSALIGAWIVAGIFTDGWAHVHVPDLETFFTPWHASFYSGLAAFALWLGVLALRLRRPGDTPLNTLRRMPTGYRSGVAGVAIFAVGGAIDMLWHTLLGIEASIDALLSPPHLILLTGVLLMATTGWRSQRALSPTATLPELISLTSVVAICGFFLNYVSPFVWAGPLRPWGTQGGIVSGWISALLITTVLVLVPFLWQLRDGRHRIGTLTGFVAALGLADAAAMSEGWKLSLLLAGVLGATLGALAAEILLSRLAPLWKTRPYGLPVVTAGCALLIWAGQLAAYAIVDTVQWPATLWAGSLALVAFTGAALGGVLWRPAEPAALAGTDASTDTHPSEPALATAAVRPPARG